MRIGVNWHKRTPESLRELEEINPSFVVSRLSPIDRAGLPYQFIARHPDDDRLASSVDELVARALQWANPGDIIQLHNEIAGEENWRRQSYLEAEAAYRLKREGHLVVFGNIAQGNVQPEQFPLLFEEAIRACHELGGWFGYHAYCWQWQPPSDPNEIWYSQRYQLFEDYIRAAGLPVPRWMFTESGCDGWRDPIGWRGRMIPEVFAQRVIAFQELIGDIPQCVFTLTAWPPFEGTFTFSGTAAVRLLAEYNRSHRETEVPSIFQEAFDMDELARTQISHLIEGFIEFIRYWRTNPVEAENRFKTWLAAIAPEHPFFKEGR
jgi:hypothetical protein